MNIFQLSGVMSSIATVLLLFLAAAPFENFRPWMRIVLLVFGLSAFLWMPWVVRFGKMNTDLALPFSAPTEVEATP